MARAARAAGAGFVIAAATLAVTWALLFQRPQPTIDGYFRLLGLDERVEVARDAYGIPHITAGTRRDMFFMQGYVTAQDRLAQMELLRRRAPVASATTLAPGTRDALEAYAAGATKLIEQLTAAGSLPGDLVLAGIRPTPWTAADSLAVANAFLRPPAGTSKCWAALTTRKGRPLLGADVYSDAPGPGFYEIGLAADARAVGISLPGVPGLIAGQNGWTAWALLEPVTDPGATVDWILGALSARSIKAIPLGPPAHGVAFGCAADIFGAASAPADVGGPADIEFMRTSFLGATRPISGARLIADLSEVDMSRSAVSSGASGHPTSPHFNDQAALWQIGQVHALVLSRSAIGATDGVLTFRPR